MDGTTTNLQRAPVSVSRYELMLSWLREQIGTDFDISVLANDASYRCYYRVSWQGQSRVVMDAPPEKESVDAFVIIAHALRDAHVMVPEIYAQAREQGFLLLSDFGDELYFKHLSLETADHLYTQAFNSILSIQACIEVKNYDLPKFSAARLHEELGWFQQWYVGAYLGLSLSTIEQQALSSMFSLIVNQALSQPQVLVHKDFHSRNLFVLDHGDVGVIDFQDALIGPITYDLMSLLYDHYIAWPREKIVEWVRVFHAKLVASGRTDCDDFTVFLQWHDWLMLQRVMKNLGNFVRINEQQGKSGYLQDIPRIFNYIMTIAAEYSQLQPLFKLLQQWQPPECV